MCRCQIPFRFYDRINFALPRTAQVILSTALRTKKLASFTAAEVHKFTLQMISHSGVMFTDTIAIECQLRAATMPVSTFVAHTQP